jgi:hypothetical protein
LPLVAAEERAGVAAVETAAAQYVETGHAKVEKTPPTVLKIVPVLAAMEYAIPIMSWPEHALKIVLELVVTVFAILMREKQNPPVIRIVVSVAIVTALLATFAKAL